MGDSADAAAGGSAGGGSLMVTDCRDQRASSR